MRFQVPPEDDENDFVIKNFKIEEDYGNRDKSRAYKLLDKYLSIGIAVVIGFLSVSGIYGLAMGGDFTALSSVWGEVREPLFAVGIFLARGLLDDETHSKTKR